MNSRPPSSVFYPTSNQAAQDSYEYELIKLIERERMATMAQTQSTYQNQHQPYLSSVNEVAALQRPSPFNPQSSQQPPPLGMTQLNRRLVAPTPPITGSPLKNAPSSAKPLRIVIIRHAERVDAILGSDWSKKSFDRSGRYIRFSEHLPEALPSRSYLHHYVIDVPLTNRGRLHAFKTGRALLLNGYAADICYTSPSLRCVQSADGILTGMGRKAVPMQLEPGLFECYLNDFKRTLCFMTKEEQAANGYNIEKSYPPLMPFMRPHDSQLDYYERCRVIMDTIIERHQATGGTILIVAHAPSLEGLTRHLSGGKLQPEKLFDIARRVPFLAMTIVEKNTADGQWLFRTQPLQTGPTPSMRETALELQTPIHATPAVTRAHTPAVLPQSQPPVPIQQTQQQLQQTQQQLQQAQQQLQQTQHQQQQRINQIQQLRAAGKQPVDLTKVVTKSSTAPNLRTSHSLSEMFRVI